MKTLKCISSMATREFLKKLVSQYESADRSVSLESVGGVDAVKRLDAGEKFDVAVLGEEVFIGLIARGVVKAGTVVPVALSQMVIAVSDKGNAPTLDTREQLIETLKAAPAIGYSSGPSGKALLSMLEQWGVMEELKSRLLQAPPGIPVGDLIASGKVSIGFQQRSELIHSEGVTIVGAMPTGYEVNTTFSAGVCEGAQEAELAANFIEFIAGASAQTAIREEGMTPF